MAPLRPEIASRARLQRQRLARHGDEQLFERFLAVLAGQSFRVAFEQDVAVRKKQHAVGRLPALRTCCARSTARPPRPAEAKSRILARTSRAVAGSSDAVGSSSRSKSGRLSMALARHTRVCSPEESTPHFVSRKRSRSNSREQRVRCALPDEVLHAIDQPEDAQVLANRQIAGQRRIDGGEIGVLQGLGAVLREIESFDADRGPRWVRARRGSC